MRNSLFQRGSLGQQMRESVEEGLFQRTTQTQLPREYGRWGTIKRELISMEFLAQPEDEVVQLLFITLGSLRPSC